MKVEVNTINDFCSELSRDAEFVLSKIVRVRIDETPEQDEAVSFTIGMWATAVIHTDDQDYILEFGGVAGSDDEEDERQNGRFIATRWKDQVAEVCDSHELQLRTGKIEVF